MEYKELATLYHMDSSSNRKANNLAEAKKRLEQDSTFKIGYTSTEGDPFIAVPRELSMLNEKVLRTERLVSSRMKALPGIAGWSMLRGLVLDEIVSSNLIEGVYSTRRQIKDVLNALDSQVNAKRRFKELATLYLAVLDGSAVPPSSPQEVRETYDKVMDGELSDKDKPDGALFRAQGVDVMSGTRVIHSGLLPEMKITEAVSAMLSVAAREDMPSLYSALASHYLFEYAHPFYDGNGRTGRYLLALYLRTPLSVATSLSLSRTIAEHKARYYKAFETAQNPLNHGELTHFIFEMLSLVSLAQEGILARLDASDRSLETINSAMATFVEGEHLKEKEKQVVYMLMQYEMFGLFGDAPLSEIAEHLSVGRQMARRYVGSLEKIGVVEKIHGRNPVTFGLTENFKRKYNIIGSEDNVPAV